jgi:hypothetical protein
MGLFTRSSRSFGPAAALIAAAAFLAAPATVSAQEKLQPQAAGAANAEAGEPVIVVTLASIDKLMKDVNYIAAMMGQEQAGGMFSMMAATFTQGIDLTRPMAALVPLVDGMPQPVGLIPTNDIKSVLKRLEAQTGPADELDDGTMVIAVGANTVYIKQQGDWAVIAASREHLDIAPQDPTPLLEGLGNDYVIAARIKPQQVPESMRAMLVDQIRQGFEQASAAQGDAADGSQELAQNSLGQLESMINETETLSLGINVDASAKQMIMDMVFTGKDGSPMAELYANQKAIPSKFVGVVREDALAYVHGACSVGPKAIDSAKSAMQTALKSVDDMLAQQDAIGYDIQSEISAYLERLGNVIVDSVSEGRMDFGAALVPADGGVGFVAGSFVADGNEVAKIFKEIAGKVEYQPGAPSFKFDAETYQGVNIHIIEGDIPAEVEEARKVFGETVTVYLGTGEKTVYLAVGNDAKKLMTTLIDSGADDTPSDRPLMQAHVKVQPILELLQGIQANDSLAAMIEALEGSEDPGMVNVTSSGIKNGQKIRVTMSEALVKGLISTVMANQDLGF